jgi:lipoprotein NlpD
MTDTHRPFSRLWAACGALLVLAGCATSRAPAPVEDRSAAKPAATRPAEPAKPTPAAPVEVKPGSYVVKPGDTLMRIALENGQGWRDIARWNSIENPNLIEVGQVLRVVPPEGPAVATRPVSTPKVESKPLPVGGASAASGASAAASATPTPAPAPATPREADDDIAWSWPASGPVVSGFDEVRSKGLSIGGRAGDPVLAAADGRVVYAGSGLRGYGNLVIVKHNATYLTAYAHNQTLLVKEDQSVKKGQKIAEMGSTDAERVQLHFEIRRMGKPVDPAKLLPSR